MVAKIIVKDSNSLIVDWEDINKGFGQLSMEWDNKKGVYILDSEHMNVHTILEIFKSI